MRLAGNVDRAGYRRGVYRIFVLNHEEKRSLGKPRRKWEDNVKIDFKQNLWEILDCTDLAQDRDRLDVVH
jgi:hypothetical protein